MKKPEAFEWEKLGKVFDPKKVQGRAWLNEFAQAPCVLELDDVLRVFFSCRPAPDMSGQYVSHSAWVDIDKSNLTNIRQLADAPVMPLGDLAHSTSLALIQYL